MPLCLSPFTTGRTSTTSTTTTLTYILLVLLDFSSRVASASGSDGHGDYNNINNTSMINNNDNNDNNLSLSLTVSEAFPQLSNLQRSLASGFSLTTGAQDLDHCCLLAVNDSLSVINGSLIGFKPDQSFIADNFTTFRSKQFPCAASYIGDKNGAPPVTIPYSYCITNCPGWQRSKTSKLNQWVSPFVGFLVPSLAFCLAIPRRYVHPLLSPICRIGDALERV